MAVLFPSNAPASHWYAADGSPVHTVPGRNGDRPTWITDAIRLGLLPSVTNILGVVAKPELDKWKQKQVALACAHNPRGAEESEEYYIRRVLEVAKQPTTDAADLGSRIHEALELATSGQPFDETLRVHVDPVVTWFAKTGIQIVEREVVLVNLAEGYAGRCDALFRYGKAGIGVIDFKTRKTEAGKTVTPYDGQGAQLAAYGAAYFGVKALPKCLLANIYISTTEPGRMEVCKHADPAAEYDFFLHCAAVWRKQKSYDPRRKENAA